jgi:hypothetical protein
MWRGLGLGVFQVGNPDYEFTRAIGIKLGVIDEKLCSAAVHQRP